MPINLSSALSTPHLDSQRPYGYRFDNINVYHVTTKDRQDLNLYDELEETHVQKGDIQIGENNPHMKRIIWEIACHIEGCFGLPFGAIIVERLGYITIHADKNCKWWNSSRVDYHKLLSQYLMGLRSLLNILR